MKKSGHGHQEAEKRTAIRVISDFLYKFWKPLTIILGTIAVLVFALFVVLSIRNARIERSYIAAEGLQDQYTEWLALAEEEQVTAYEQLLEGISEISTEYSGLYAGARADLINGQALMILKRPAEAAEVFLQVAETMDQTYLAPVALLNAGVALEDAGDAGAALEPLKSLADEYSDSSPDAPRALFSIARINEGLGELAEAALVYNRLIEDYPTSSWTNLARTRIITLTAQGRIGE